MSHEPNIVLVPLAGDLSVRTASALKRTLASLLRSGAPRIVLDMADVPYVDSTCMAVIFGAVRAMRSKGGLLSLTNVKPAVLRALRIARLVDYAPVSVAGAHREVPELDASTLPLWRTTLPVDADGLQTARVRIEELASRLPFSQDAIFDLTLAAGEALGNAADHTCGEGILATVSAYRDRMIIEVADCGRGFDPNVQGIGETNEDAERGRGIKLMRLLVDSVTILPRPAGNGMVVRLVKLV